MKVLTPVSFIVFFLMVGNLTAQNIFIHGEQELQFGDFFLSENKGGTIRISNTGQRSFTGGVNLLSANYSPAIFNISTDSQAPIEVEIDAYIENMINAEGAEMPLEVNETHHKVYTLEAGKPLRLFIGGTLKIDPGVNQSLGSFKGVVTLSANLYR